MELSTLEKFILVGHHKEKPKFVIPDLYMKYGIIGAILLEMSRIEDVIKIENDYLKINPNFKTDDPMVADVIEQIRNSKKIRKVKYWMNKLSRNSTKYKWSLVDKLEKKSIFRVEHKKFLGLIPYRKVHLMNIFKRQSLINQLRNSILFREELKEENMILLALIEACQSHKVLSDDKKERKEIKRKLKVIIEESPIAGTLDKTIKEVQAAVMASVVASTVASSAVTR